jgi:hypothetical protein
VAAAAAAAPSPPAPAYETIEVRVHWILRTMAVLPGLVLFFLGSLCLSLCVKMAAGPANPAAPPAAALVAQILTTALVGGVVLLGAFLIWVGMRRWTRRIDLRSAQPAAQPPAGAATPVQSPDFGALIAQCGPQADGQTNYLICGIVLLILGVLAVIGPYTFFIPKPGDEAGVKGFLWLFGGMSLVGGAFLLWSSTFGQNQTIFLYERALVERVGSTCYAIALDEIEQLRIQEWYDHRFAPRTFNVRAKVRGRRELKFNSALRGDSERIIAYLAERVTNTEMVPFQA